MIITLIISILPVYLVGLYIYKKDKNKEPKSLLKRLFIYGMLSCIPAAIVEILLGNFFAIEKSMNLVALFFYVFISVALVEELFKWVITYRLTYNNNEFDELYDAIVYAVFVSLGFACFENIFYVLDAGVKVGLFRAITAIPGHVSDAIIMGNYIGLAKLASTNNSDKLRNKNLLLSILIPTLAHTFYDYCLFTENVYFLLIFTIFLISIYIYSFKKVKRISSSKNELSNNKIVALNNHIYCHKCGTKNQGNYCYKCGTKLR